MLFFEKCWLIRLKMVAKVRFVKVPSIRKDKKGCRFRFFTMDAKGKVRLFFVVRFPVGQSPADGQGVDFRGPAASTSSHTR